jgi:transposase
MDLGKKRSDVCVMAAADQVSERFKVTTTRESLSKMFARRPAAQIAVESCRSSSWVKEQLEQLGHTVVVIDTTRVRALGVGQGRRKNDQRDAEMLARALCSGVVPRAHVLSHEARRVRDVLHTRAQLVAQRTALVTMIRGQFEAQGIVVPTCDAAKFAATLGRTDAELVEGVHIQAVLRVLASVNQELEVLTAELEALAARQEAYPRLCTVPGVKLIVALSFIAALDRADRFRDAHQVEAYLGLVPSEMSTGGRQRLGHITKAGNPRARVMLVQAAHVLLRARRHQDDPLVVWAHQLAARRGKRIAVVALARRLTGVLWAMWQDGTDYDARAVAGASAAGMSRRLRRSHQEVAAMQRLTIG